MPVDRLDRAAAQTLLRKCLAAGQVKTSWHFRQELAKETITFADVEFVLRSGNIYGAPEQEAKTGEWKYKVEGLCADRQNIAVVFCFKQVDRVLLITVFSVK
jgi:uncharacterized DUF497 family protein